MFVVRSACLWVSLALFCVLPGCGGEAEAPLSSQCALRAIALYQAVKVPLMSDGVPSTERSAPIVAGRPGMFRLFVDDNFADQRGMDRLRVDAELHLFDEGDHEVAVVSARDQRVATAIEESLETTIALRFDGNAIRPRSRFYVVLRRAGTTGDIGCVRYPTAGTESLAVRPEPAKLKIRLVPLTYGRDGTNRFPDVSPEELGRLERGLFDLYPVASVSIAVRESIPWPSSVSADGEGWDAALDAVMALRNSDALAADVYDVGLVAPADSYEVFCRYGCVAGEHATSFQTRRDPVKGRAVIVLGYPDDWIRTIAHELGHAMGRDHAPCGRVVDDIDVHYPYADGLLGSFGYSLSTGRLVGSHRGDLMGYCRSIGVSDYTYSALFERIALVTSER